MRFFFILLVILTLPLFAKVNINTASKSELTKLPGIGASKAQKIINFREFEHKFNSVDDLLKVSGFSESLLEKIKDEVEVGNTIALVGSTGKSTGPHVHLEVRDSEGNKLNPYFYLTQE